jgi:hypothetical protein
VQDGAHNSGKTSAYRSGARIVTVRAALPGHYALMDLLRAVAVKDTATVLRLLAVSPALAAARLEEGATR